MHETPMRFTQLLERKPSVSLQGKKVFHKKGRKKAENFLLNGSFGRPFCHRNMRRDTQGLL